LGTAIKENCISCHKDSAAQHETWLPNSGRHFEAVSCVACHAPDAQRRINLRLVDGYGKPQIQEASGSNQFERITGVVNTSGGSLNEKELRNFLRIFNAEHGTGKAMLNGRLEVRSGVQAHQLSEKELALKDCSVCHQAGASPFQTVVLTMAGADGRPMRQEVDKDVLNSVTSIGLLRGFYTIGSSRIQFLDYLLVLVVLGVSCVPLAHYTVHRMFRRKREQLHAQRALEAASLPNDQSKV
jgi:mono/diheme cytochrome c family protein